MAVVTGGLIPFNMGDPLQFGAMLYSFATGTSTSTSFTTINPETGGRWQFQGSDFGGFIDGIPTAGTITSISYDQGGVPAFGVVGLSLTIQTFFAFIAADDVWGLMGYIFDGADTISGSPGYDNLFGYGGDDTITGGPGGDALNGGDGNDTLHGGADFDSLTGGAGNDLLHGNDGGDHMQGNDGDDTLNGGAGSDEMDGGAGNDILNGGDDGDLIVTGTGVDTVDGGASIDRVTIDRGISGLAYAITFSEFTTASGATLADGTTVKNVERFSVTTGSGDDVFMVDQTAIPAGFSVAANVVDGGAGFDRLEVDFTGITDTVATHITWANIEQLIIRAGSADDALTGGAGDDEFYGNGGADTLFGGAGQNLLDGGDGNDTLQGGAGEDTILGGAGDDLFYGSAGGDTVDGGDGVDEYAFEFGASGVFNLTGMHTAAGATLSDGTILRNLESFDLTAGGGDDTVQVNSGLRDSQFYGGAGVDVLIADLSAESTIVTLNTTSSGALTTAAGWLRTQQVERAEIVGGSGNDSLQGWALNDVLSGGAGADTLDGDAGDDTLNGGDGDDVLIGGGGVNVILGGGDNDTLHSITGGDTVDGGAGVDRGVISRAASSAHFALSNAVIASAPGSTWADGSAISGFESFDITTGSGDDTLTLVFSSTLAADSRFDAGGGANLVIADFSAATNAVILFPYAISSVGWGFVSLEGFQTRHVTGGAANDFLDGGEGDDVLTGGAGADALDGAAGVDTLSGGAGNDTLRLLVGADVGHSGADNDIIFLGVDDAIGYGDDGADHFYFTGAGTADGGAGTDSIEINLQSSSTGSVFDARAAATGPGAAIANGLVRDVESVVFRGGSGADVVTFGVGSVGENRFLGFDGHDRLIVDLSAFNGVVTSSGLLLETSEFYVTTHTVEEMHYFGGSANDSLEGFTGADLLRGNGGADTLRGMGGADMLEGGDGVDTLFGYEGDDVLHGGAGADALDGSDGIDTADYTGSNARVVVSLLTGLGAGGHAQGDTLTGVENLTGSSHNDELIGNADANVLRGGAGADQLNGGDGVDTADYSTSTARIVVRLSTGLGESGHAQGDTLTSVENLTGSAFNDALIGSAVANALSAGAGNDYLDGGAGDDVLNGGDGDDRLAGGAGADQLIGGDGIDLADYSSTASRVVVRLWNGLGESGHAQGDTLTGIENLTGSGGNDALIGASGANVLRGGLGNDRLDGLEGDDLLMGGVGGDTMLGGAGNDTVSYEDAAGRVVIRLSNQTAVEGEAAGDVISGFENAIGGAGNDALIGDGLANTLDGRGGADYLDGGAGNDILLGGAGVDRLAGGAGADQLIGGDGIDLADYSSATARVVVRLTTGLGESGHAQGDTFTSIENLTGSNFNDALIGANLIANVLRGGGGDDYLDGLSGDDVLDGGAGVDRLNGGAGADTFLFVAGQGQGDQVLDFASGQDQLRFEGYGAGATLTQLDATHWRIASADGLTADIITLTNAALIAPGDYLFV